MAGAIPPPLSAFVGELNRLLEEKPPDYLYRAAAVFKRLLAGGGSWLPEAYRRPNPLRYQQRLLYRDPLGRFSIVNFVWAPGQGTPIHDHQVWGLIGVLEGAEYSQSYALPADPAASPIAQGGEKRREQGDIDITSPTLGDIHRVRNAFDDRRTVSLHVYGADIGMVSRWVYSAEGPISARRPFFSGYSNDAETPPFFGLL